MSDKNHIADNRRLIAEWDYKKNAALGLDASKITCGSNKKAWWQCKEGHTWEAIIANRNKGQGCPICGNRRVLTGYNDLATRFPDIAKEWNLEKNAPLLPSTVMFRAHKKVWWCCALGHEWQANIIDRTKANGTGCPFCSGRKAILGKTDLQTLRPDLLEEWNYDRNIDISPSEVSPGSGQKVWWICKKGHE